MGLLPPPPVFYRIICPDFGNSIKSKMIPLCDKFIPPYEIEKYDGEYYVYHFKNGSLLELKSNEQKMLKFASVDRHRVGADEPIRHDLFGENLARLVTHRGGFDFTQTPEWNEKNPWVKTELLPQAKMYPEAGAAKIEDIEGLDEIRDAIRKSGSKVRGITEIRGTWKDNIKNLDPVGVLEFFANLPEAERKVRETGDFPEGSSLLFGDQFVDGVHTCQPFKVPRNRLKFGGIDMGIGCPTVHLWAFVGDYSDLGSTEASKYKANIKDPVLFIYREYYQRGRAIPQNAGEIQRLSGIEQIQLTLLDPKSGSKRDEQTGDTRQSQWADAGIQTVYGATSVEAGLTAIASLMLCGEKDPKKRKHPRIIIFTSCKETIKEMKKSSVDDLKKTDSMHCISVLRWLASAKLLENWVGASVKIKGAAYTKKETQEFLRKRRASLPRRI